MNPVTRLNTPRRGAPGIVVVVGAGAAGMAAAITSARHGEAVWLVELTKGPGGTVANSLIHTLGGIFDEQQRFINDGIVCELVERLQRASELTRPRRIGKTCCLNVCPEVYRNVVDGWIREEPLIETLYDSRVARVTTVDGRVQELELVGPQGTRRTPVKSLIDATGTAEVVRMIDESCVHDDDERAAGGLIFRLRGVQPRALAFPKGVVLVQRIQAAARAGSLPSLCAHAWLDQGVFDDEVFVKLFVPMTGDWRRPGQLEKVLHDARPVQARLMEYLKAVPDFAQARLDHAGELGIRDGGRIKGEYYLTVDDVRAGRKFADAACRCCWPIEYWNPQSGLELEYLPPGTLYEIPLAALKVKGLQNVWGAGKCLSADHRAQASARVVGQCWAMGQAAGRAAAAVPIETTAC